MRYPLPMGQGERHRNCFGSQHFSPALVTDLQILFYDHLQVASAVIVKVI